MNSFLFHIKFKLKYLMINIFEINLHYDKFATYYFDDFFGYFLYYKMIRPFEIAQKMLKTNQICTSLIKMTLSHKIL